MFTKNGGEKPYPPGESKSLSEKVFKPRASYLLTRCDFRDGSEEFVYHGGHY